MLQPWFDLDIVESGTLDPVPDVVPEARAALARPRGSRPLADLAREAVAARPEANAIIAVTDLTRASPDRELVPPLLDELNRGGIPDDRVTVMIGVGLHRGTTDE